MILVACGGDSGAPMVPDSGLVLLDLKSGAQVAALSVGSDPVAVTLSSDGSTAYVADSSPGDVYAVKLSARRVVWRAHVGGAPFGLLFGGDRLYVSLFTGGSVDELALDTGRVLASHMVGAGPAVMTADVAGRPLVALHSGGVASLDGQASGAARGYGIVAFGADVWTCDYAEAKIVRVDGGKEFPAPKGLSPFWLAQGADQTMLIASEGADEDRDAGGVFRLDLGSGQFKTLASPRDPDQVIESAQGVFVAAHGDRDVLHIAGGQTSTWAHGASAVALAADQQLNLLVVAINAHE